jgi:hypothetical protein
LLLTLIDWYLQVRVGETVGASVVPVGEVVGVCVGLSVVGLPEGESVGDLEEGLSEGDEVGNVEGEEVGFFEGTFVGNRDGLPVGCADGVSVGSKLITPHLKVSKHFSAFPLVQWGLDSEYPPSICS